MYFDYLTTAVIPKYLEETDNNNKLVTKMLKGRKSNPQFDEEQAELFKKALNNIQLLNN